MNDFEAGLFLGLVVALVIIISYANFNSISNQEIEWCQKVCPKLEAIYNDGDCKCDGGKVEGLEK